MSAKDREQNSAGSRKQDGEEPADESIPSLEGDKESLPNDESASLKSDEQTVEENGTSEDQEASSEKDRSDEGAQDVTEGGEEESDKNGAGSTTNGADDVQSSDGAVRGNSGEEVSEETGSSFSSAEVHSSKRGRGKKRKDEPNVAVPDGEHTVTLSVVIAKAIPTGKK